MSGFGRRRGRTVKERFLIDLDGTIYRGNALIPHAGEFIDFLNRNGADYLFATNCPLRRPERTVEKLIGLGLDVRRDCVISSGMAAIRYLLERHPGEGVYVVGSRDLVSMCEESGIRLADGSAGVVLVGFDPEFDYGKMRIASQAIRQGAVFLATNLDATIPDGDKLVPHTGSIAAAIAAASGREPIYLGKPEPYFFEFALSELDCRKSDIVIIGDRIDTDMRFAMDNGARGCLVLTGLTSREEAKTPVLSDRIIVADDLRDIIEQFSRERANADQSV